MTHVKLIKILKVVELQSNSLNKCSDHSYNINLGNMLDQVLKYRPSRSVTSNHIYRTSLACKYRWIIQPCSKHLSTATIDYALQLGKFDFIYIHMSSSIAEHSYTQWKWSQFHCIQQTFNMLIKTWGIFEETHLKQWETTENIIKIKIIQFTWFVSQIKMGIDFHKI